MSLAVPAADLDPGVRVIHGSIPASPTVGVGVPEVVTVKFSFLPAAMVTELPDVITAVFDDRTTLLDGDDPGPVPSALVALTVHVVDAPFGGPVATQEVVAVVQGCPLVDSTE